MAEILTLSSSLHSALPRSVALYLVVMNVRNAGSIIVMMSLSRCILRRAAFSSTCCSVIGAALVFGCGGDDAADDAEEEEDDGDGCEVEAMVVKLLYKKKRKTKNKIRTMIIY